MPRLDAKVTFTPEEIAQTLARPQSFLYWEADADKLFVTWALGPVIDHRDASPAEQISTSRLLRRLRSDPSLAADWEVYRSSHWAVGWVEQIKYRLLEDDRSTPTRMARVLKDWYQKHAPSPTE